MTLDAGALTPPALPAGATLWAAFSGGLDSTVLLHLLRDKRLPVKALHVNHNLQQVAARWTEHCRALCAQLRVPIYVMDVKVDPRDPDGPEAAARRARYEAFASVMRPGDCLATAHHQDDQAETVLLRLLRGSGVAGLAAMRAVSTLPPGTVWRPLLAQTRAALKDYAEQHKLPWVEDPHNLDSRYARSFLRSEVFPRLSQRWPQAVEQLARTADHCADAVELLDELATQDLAQATVGPALSVQRLLRLSPARRANLLRAWSVRGGFELPTFEALQRLEREVLRARPDAAPVLAWAGTELRRFRDHVYLMPRLAPPPDATLEWDARTDLALPPGCGILKLVKPATRELPLRVRFARGGERLKPAGARFTRTLRNLFQEEGVPPWIRERMPLIELDGALAGVAHRWETTALKRLRAGAGCEFEWQHTLPGDPG
ncbi:MAG TPA: tRNA lysidine(34) synthetase TilS [Verrucomicrobiae bacterium]|nr:tRNA lysidine(34) synthetase TilS [Verrucomicrobiae bacterium]